MEKLDHGDKYFGFPYGIDRWLYIFSVKVKSAYANVAHQAGAYPDFRNMKRLGVFLLPPGWDASPSQGYPPALSSPVPIYTPGRREAL